MSWTRKILRVDLGTGTCATEDLNMEWAHKYLGSRGLATKYFTEEVDAFGRRRRFDVGAHKSWHHRVESVKFFLCQHFMAILIGSGNAEFSGCIGKVFGVEVA